MQKYFSTTESKHAYQTSITGRVYGTAALRLQLRSADTKAPSAWPFFLLLAK